MTLRDFEVLRDLQAIPFFCDVLNAGQMRDLARECGLHVFAPGSVLMKEGEAGTSMFGLAEGMVTVSYRAPRGKDVEIVRLHGGSVVGEMEVLSGRARLATVTAVSDVRAIEIPRDALEKLLDAASDLAVGLGATLERRQAVYRQMTGARSSPLGRLLARVRRLR